MRRLRALLSEHGRYPTRRTWERRLGALPETLPAQIGCVGRYLVEVLRPWADESPLAAVDSTPLRARGGVWHQKDRQAGIVPHSSIDTEAHWTKSGWHGWVYGWKLHLVVTVAAVWLPLAAELTPANAADNEVAPRLLPALPPGLRYLLGDTGYDDGTLHEQCAATGRVLITSKRGRYPHTEHRPRGRGAPHLSSTALPRDRKLQRPVQGDLRHARPGAHPRPAGHPPLRAGRCPGVSANAPLSAATGRPPPRRTQALAQGGLRIYDRVSINLSTFIRPGRGRPPRGPPFTAASGKPALHR
ncbi:MAG TPA: transposase [Chloroflexota bacterium]